jgi:hypothetical protein
VYPAGAPAIQPTSPDEIDFLEVIPNTAGETMQDRVRRCPRNCPEHRCFYRIASEVIDYLKAREINFPSYTLVQSTIYRLYRVIEELGPHIIPLISAAEVKLKGVQEWKESIYELIGVADVISQIDATKLNQINITVQAFQAYNPFLVEIGRALYPNLFSPPPSTPADFSTLQQNIISQLLVEYPNGYEIILDYKTQIRQRIPQKTTNPNKPTPSTDWTKNEWQILTYKSLREMQATNSKVIAGIVFYLNEIYPSAADINMLLNKKKYKTDIPLDQKYVNQLIKIRRTIHKLKLNFNTEFPKAYVQIVPSKIRYRRAIRVIRMTDLDQKKIEKARRKFYFTVSAIRLCEHLEKINGDLKAWEADISDKLTCHACDRKYACKNEDMYIP